MSKELKGWRLSYSNNMKELVKKGLACMKMLSSASPRGRQLSAAVDKTTRLFKEKGSVDKEVIDSYNSVADMTMEMIQGNENCARLIEAIGGMEIVKQVLFSEIETPEAWLKHGVDVVCDKLEAFAKVAPQWCNINDVIYLFRTFGAKGDMPDGYWRMLGVIDVATTQVVVAQRVFESIPEWMKDGKGNEFTALELAKKHEKDLSIPLEVILRRKMFHEGSWEESLNS